MVDEDIKTRVFDLLGQEDDIWIARLQRLLLPEIVGYPRLLDVVKEMEREGMVETFFKGRNKVIKRSKIYKVVKKI